MNINKRAYFSAVIILIALVCLAGVLTALLPQGHFDYVVKDGRSIIVPDSFQFVDHERLPISQIVTAPIAVLFSSDSTMLIAIIVFLLIIGGAIHVLNKCQVLSTVIQRLVLRYENNRLHLIWAITFVFMALGAFVGIFEEIIPLVPMIIALAIALGYDKLMGLGMSLLAAGLGFAAAVSNPFTIGVAQKIADLPMFSGALFRVVIFIVTYVILNIALMLYGKKVDQGPQKSNRIEENYNQKGVYCFIGMITALVLLMVSMPFVPNLSDYGLIIIGLIFLIGGLLAGVLSDEKHIVKIFLQGMLNMAPAIVLILLATSVKYIIDQGQIMDTLLYNASLLILGTSPLTAVCLVFLIVLLMNFMIGSGSAKAFIVMPIVIPLMDMLGISRQMAVLAFQFGDGFSNLMYPTNAVLLISLGLANVSYFKWLKFTIKIQAILLMVSIAFLALGLLIGY